MIRSYRSFRAPILLALFAIAAGEYDLQELLVLGI